MPYLSGNGNDFENAIRRGATSFRSSELDAAVAAIHAYIQQPSAEHIKRVRNTLAAWRDLHPKEFSNRGAPIENALRAELTAACRQWGVPSAPPGVPAPPLPARPASADARGWVDAVRPALNLLGSYACADAYAYTTYNKATDSYDYNTGFARCVRPDARPVVEKRYREMKARKAGATTPGDALVIHGGKWNAPGYGMVHQFVTQQKAAICTQFAKAAAHVLTHGRPGGPRVEIVAYRNHVYVLVGRKGGYSGHVVDAGWVSEPGLVIVDPWAGSLGWDTIYTRYADYPLKAMANPISLVAERAAA